MKKYFIKINWKKNLPVKMYLVATKVALKMKAYNNFATAPVTEAAMEAANARLDKAIANRENGPAARIELALAATDVDTNLRKLMGFVEGVADGDQQILESSGFEITDRAPKKAVVPAIPTAVRLSSSEGSVRMIASKPEGADSLCWAVFVGGEISPINIVDNNIVGPLPGNVIITPIGTARQVLKGLQAGTLVTVQALAQNTAGKSPFSAPVSIYVNK